MTPEGWRAVKFGDVASLEYGKSLPVSHRRGGNVAVCGSNGVIGHHDEPLVGGPGIVVGRKGSIGVVTWMDGDFWPIDTTYYVSSREKMAVRWLYYATSHLRLDRLNEGTGIPGLNRNTAATLRLDLPPLPEQRKIAAILSSIDDAMEKTQTVIDQVQVVKRGLMQELLTRGLPGQHTRFKQTEIGNIPETWDLVRLAEVVSLPIGQVDPTEEPYCHWPLVAPNHIESRTGRLLMGIATASEQRAISGKYQFEPGDVLYSKIRPYLEKAVAVTCRGLCSADMYPLQPTTRIETRFLLAALLNRRFTEFANALSTRTGIPKINREQLGRYPLAIPPSAEQLQIVRFIDGVDKRFETESAWMVQLVTTKSALMSVLLTGELRVTPDRETA